MNEKIEHGMNCAAWHNNAGHEVNSEDCTCGFRFRVAAQTAETMYAAWRKRAEEAEATIAELREEDARLQNELDRLVGHVCECGHREHSWALERTGWNGVCVNENCQCVVYTPIRAEQAKRQGGDDGN